LVEGAHINQIVSALQRHYDYIIIDTDSRNSEFTKGLFSLTNQVVLVSDLDLASLKNLKIRIKQLGMYEIKEESLSLFINKSDLKVGINPSDVAELIGMQVSAYLPWDSDVTRLSNEGLAIVAEKNRSGISHALQHATDLLIETMGLAESPKTKSKGRKSA
jgi:pilus assembly protein CpaE